MLMDVKKRLDKKDILYLKAFSFTIVVRGVQRLIVYFQTFLSSWICSTQFRVQRIVEKIPKGQKLSKDIANDIGLIFRAAGDHGQDRKCINTKTSGYHREF